MVLEGLRGYLQLANGLTDVTRERALATAKILLAQGEAAMGGAMVPAVMPENVRALTDDLIATSKANRDLMVNLVRSEVERSVGRLGLVSAAELESAQRRAKRLEERVLALETELRAATARPEASAPVAKRPAAKKTAKKSAAKKTAKKSAAKKTAAKKTATKKTATKKTATNKTAAKKTATRKTAAKKSTATGSAT